jgi:hypothetical protein
MVRSQFAAGTRSRHPGGREAAERVVHERQEVGRGRGVAGPGGVQETGHVGHAAQYTPVPTAGQRVELTA